MPAVTKFTEEEDQEEEDDEEIFTKSSSTFRRQVSITILTSLDMESAEPPKETPTR